MMTLRELEETVDDKEETLNGNNRTHESQRPQTALHSTQSITGRASLLTRDHIQYLSASDALSAYISDFEDSHPLETSLYQRTVEDLLLPRSILSKTVDRSLETGKRDTREEYHLHNVKRIIDESFEEIIRADSKQHHTRAVSQDTERHPEEAKSDLSSLPGPNVSGLSRITPVRKSTPLKPQVESLSLTYQERKPSKNSWISRGATELSARVVPPLKVKWDTDAQSSFFSNKRAFRSSVTGEHRIKPFTKVDIGDDLDTAGFSNSFKSGGRRPPTWVEELDQSSVTLSSLGYPDEEKSIPIRKEDFPDGSLPNYRGHAPADKAGELVRWKLDEGQMKRMREGAMKEQWLQDRRNESRSLKQLYQRKPKLGRTESVTTDDLLNASPYNGLDKRKSRLISDKGHVVNITRFKEPQRYSDYKLLGHRGNMLSKSDDSIERRAKLQKSGRPLEFSTVGGASRSVPPVSKFSSGTFRTLPVVSQMSTGSMVFKRDYSPHPTSSTHTESLVHASPCGYEASSPAYRNSKTYSFTTSNKSFLQNGDDESTSAGGPVDDLETIGSVGGKYEENLLLMSGSKTNYQELHHSVNSLLHQPSSHYDPEITQDIQP